MTVILGPMFTFEKFWTMIDLTQPRFPIYIPSKSRADTATTPRILRDMNVPFRLVIEEEQYASYAEFFTKKELIILDPQYKKYFDPLISLPEDASRGSGPARNFIWDHSIKEGHEFHWIMDDNIEYFVRLHKNQRMPVGDGMIFHAMESFVLRYTNVGMAGPQYMSMVPSRTKYPPFITGSRIYSCILIRNDVPLRWRGRYNEDTILSLDMLKSQWNTILFYAFLQNKMQTQKMGGGNTEAFYAEEGTLPKSQMLVDAHPDVARVAWWRGRWHHYVNYKQFRYLPLIKKQDLELPEENPYRFKRIKVEESIYRASKENKK